MIVRVTLGVASKGVHVSKGPLPVATHAQTTLEVCCCLVAER